MDALQSHGQLNNFISIHYTSRIIHFPIKAAHCAKMQVKQQSFGVTASGDHATKWTIDNGSMSIALTNYGATILAVNLPAGNGVHVNVAPCHQSLDKLAGDIAANPKMGTTCGRVCNRTAGAAFELDGKKYALVKNDGDNHIHGGFDTFDKKVWKCTDLNVTPSSVTIKLTLSGADGEEGYPGSVCATAVISLDATNTLGIEYSAVTTDGKSTPLALTNHCYWNLRGLQSGSIMDHTLQINSDEFVAADPVSCIPNGILAPVTALDDSGTSAVSGGTQAQPMDFRTASTIATKLSQIPKDYAHIGFNTSYVVRGWRGDAASAEHGAAVDADEVAAGARAAASHPASVLDRLHLGAIVTDPATGRSLQIATTHPCVHFYSTYAWSDQYQCEGVPMTPGSALALECQHPPDTANQSYSGKASGVHIPRSILRPGEHYHHLTLHKFSWPGANGKQ